MLEAAVGMVTDEAVTQLRALGRRVVLRVETVAGQRRGEWLLSTPNPPTPEEEQKKATEALINRFLPRA